ncbi:MAG: AAA family ATPase [Thermoleophilaceae bacterium]|nr:AAA family ATPase [Thermoleophilaceae bacterium]
MVRTELVGRERELTALARCLEASLGGEPRLVVCRGEPGIGKTRLAEELASLATAKGVPAVWGRGVESDGAPPYWPWRQLMRAAAGVVDMGALADEHRLTADVSMLAPDAFRRAEQAVDTASSEDRFRQFDAVGRLLRHVAAHTPLVIILDDVHWADQPSLLLLQHVAQTLTDERLLFLVNCRETERAHWAIVTDLLRSRLTRELHLGGLPTPAVAKQLASVVGHEVSDHDAEEVCTLTRGNPFFVGEMARVLGDRQAGVSHSLVTTSVREAIGARLRRLSPEAVRLLQAASIVGREVPIAVVAAVVGLSVADCLSPLDEAVAAGLVEMGPTPAEHQFPHALVRDAIEAGLATSKRVRLHRRAAEAIEKTYAGRLEPHLFDLARHWAVAAVEGDATTAATWIQRAAEEAMRSLAFEEAARLFRLALDVASADLDDVARCRLHLRLGGALHASADVNGRLDACLQAAATARRMGRPDLIAEAALILVGVFGNPESDLATRRLCEEAMAGLDPGPTALRARVTARFAEACMYLGDVENAGPASEEALALAMECGAAEAVVASLHARQLVCEGPDGVEERERLAERMLALGRQDRNPSVEMWARLWRVDASFERGDLLAVARELATLAPLVQEVGGPWAQWQLLRGQGVLAQAQARFAEARRLAAEAFAAIARTGHPIAGLPRAGLLQTVGHHIGQDEESLDAFGLSDATVDAADFPASVVMMVLGPAHILIEAGRLAEGALLYRSLGPVAGWRPHAHATLAAYAFGVVVATALDATDDVASLRRLLLPYRGLHVASGAGAIAYVGPTEIWLGVAAGHLGLLDDAVADLERAVRACAVSGADGFHAEAQYELAAVLARREDRGDLTRARSLVADGARQATELGMAPIATKAANLIEKLHASDTPAKLTRRERDVAELVAKGMTNREIAEQLYLSERTAQNHVQHILTKLALSNRSQIAVWMTGQK